VIGIRKQRDQPAQEARSLQAHGLAHEHQHLARGPTQRLENATPFSGANFMGALDRSLPIATCIIRGRTRVRAADEYTANLRRDQSTMRRERSEALIV
jgi:hypothetical protein